MQTLSWWKIIAILIGVAIISGLIFGFLGDLLGLSSSMKGGGIGAIIGIAAAFLIARKRASVYEK